MQQGNEQNYLNVDILNTMAEQIGRDGVGELAQIYITSSRETVDALMHACQSGAGEEMRALAHQLKGASGTLGLDDMMLLAKNIEFSCREDNVEQAKKFTNEGLEDCYAHTINALKSYLDTLGN